MHFDEAATELLSITVDGTDHSYEATVDANHDGTDDTVHVDTDHGSYEYTNTDGDGSADTLSQFDPDGHVTGRAVFDAATGEWDDTASPEPTTLHGVDPTAAPTIDSNADGVADTALTHAADGATVLATDTDGDGSADTVTEIDATGAVTTYDHASDGTWRESGHGNLADEQAPAVGHAVIDPTTGAWIRQ